MSSYCPGAKQFIQPKPEDRKCPSCGVEVEVWTDELKATCPRCKKTIMREGAPACLEWCAYAKQCVGTQVYDEYMEGKAATVRRKLLEALEGHFGEDTKRIAHARRVMEFAEELLKEEQADWHIVIPASILHDFGIKSAEAKYGSSAPGHQEKEGPAIARKILLGLGLKMEHIDEICDIVANHHSPGKIDTRNFAVLCDADQIVNLKHKAERQDRQRVEELIEETFLTAAGKELARKTYLAPSP